MAAPSRRRLLIQYLEPSAAVDAATAGALAAHLAGALDRLPVTDLALGWKLRLEVVEAVREVVPGEVTVWRWVPVFTDSGSGRVADTYVAVGPDGAAPPPFRALADFRFLCLDHDEVVDGGFERVLDLAEIASIGLLEELMSRSTTRR